ncbi:MAG: NTP transferase domain-containing protein [Clostridia bacterium]|nr:NTP transferase domain-containing protein [Clostridia bacterium]
MKTSLVIMAAGMGSRFGGLKQIEPIGPHGEAIVDYSVADAIRAGFDEIVFIIKKEIEEDFKNTVGKRIEAKAPVKYVYQTMPDFRNKPLGTGDAVLACRDVVKNPFAVINADDYYGADAYKKIHEHLISEKDYAMVSYELSKTVSENGTVSRGVCKIKDGFLESVTEFKNIAKDNDFPKGTIVSMNFWGLNPSIFDELSKRLEVFKKTADLENDEFYIQAVISDMIKEGCARVRVLKTRDRWYGVTYKEDKAEVVRAIRKFTAEGKYE